MAIKIEGEEQDFIAQDEDEGRTGSGSPSLLTQPAATQQEPTPPSRLMTGNARPLHYLDTYGNRTDTDPVPAPIQTGQAHAARTDIRGFIRPLTPEENEKYQEQKRRRLEYGMPGVIEEIFRENRQAWEHNPEERAKQLWLANRTGIPESMMGDSDVYREAQIRNQMMMDSILLQDAPERVIEWFGTPGALDVARDDIPTLTAMGRALERLAVRNAPTQERTFGDAWREGMAVVAGGYADKRFMESGVEGNDLIWNEAWWMLPEEEKVRLREQRRKNLFEAETWWRKWEKHFTPEAALRSGGFRGFAQDVVQGLPYTLKSMATNAPFALLGPAGAAAGAVISATDEAETEQARVFKERVARGEDPMTVYNDTFNSVFLPNVGLLAASNYLQNRLTFGPVSRGGQGILANPWVRRAGELGLSSMFEGGEEIGQSLISSWSLGDEINIADLLYEGSVGAGTGLFFSGGGAAINTVFGKYTQYRQAKQNIEAFQALSDTAAASKLKERNPRLFRNFIERATANGPVQEVGIPAERFAEYFQSQGIDPVQMAEDLGIGNQYSEATLAGTDLTIPIATFTEKLAGSEHFAGLQEDLRLGENAMTAREAREFEQNLVQEFDQAIREASETETEYQANREAADRIREDLKAQIIALNHKALGSKQAEFTAALYTSWLVNEARLQGISPQDLADRVNLRVEYDKTTGDPVIRRTAKNTAQEWFNQPLGPDVDLEARVNVIPVARTLPNLPTWLRKKKFPTEVRERVMKDFSDGIANRHTGMTLTLASLGLDHILHTARNDTGVGGEIVYHSVPQLGNLAQEAYRVDPQEDLKASPRKEHGSGALNTVHRFVVPVELDGRQHILMLTAKEYEPGKAVIDGAKLYDMKHVKEMPGRPSQDGSAYAGEGIADSPDRSSQGEAKAFGDSFPTTTLTRPGDLSVREMVEGVKDAYGENYLQSYDAYGQDVFSIEEKLDQEEAAFGEVVDYIDANKGSLVGARTEKMMTTPLALLLAEQSRNTRYRGNPAQQTSRAEIRDIMISHAVLEKIMTRHNLSPEQVKTLPRALVDPIAVFESAPTSQSQRKGNAHKSIVAMIEMTDQSNATVVVPVYLEEQTYGQKGIYNIVPSAYGRAFPTGVANDAWFVKEAQAGRLLYLDTKKSSAWSHSSQLYLPSVATLQNLNPMLKTEADLVNARKANEYYFQSASPQTTALHLTPEALRQVAERIKNTPSSQWTQEDYTQARAFDEQFDPTDMDTWGLSPEDRAKLQHLEDFDAYEYAEWPDPAKRQRARELDGIIGESDVLPAEGTPKAAIFDRMAELEALSDEESSPATDAEYEKLEKQWDKIQSAARKEFDALEREMDRLSEKRFKAREELGNLLSGRLQMQIENYPDYSLNDFRHPANKDIASILNMLREAEALPAEQWSPELRGRMADFIASGHEDAYWGRNPYDREQYLQAYALDEDFPATWANYEETADLGRRGMDLEERIATTLDPQEKKALRSELAALKKEVKPLLKEAAEWREDVIAIDEARSNAILEKAKSLGLEKEETYYQREQGNTRPYGKQLHLDEQAWAKAVDDAVSGKTPRTSQVRVMTTPLALHPAGGKTLPVYMRSGKIGQIMREHDLSADLIKQVPAALADPVAIFKSQTEPRSLVVMTELRDSNGATVVVPFHLAKQENGYLVNKLASIYGKDQKNTPNAQGALAPIAGAPEEQSVSLESRIPNNQWFVNQMKEENLRYLNREKASAWSDETGEPLPAMNVPSEIDLANYRETYDGYYQGRDTNSRAARGYSRFIDGETVIGILKNGDRSTFLHEMAHLFLETRRQFSLEADVPEMVRQDWAKITDWLGVSDIDFSKPLSEADRKRWTNAQEKWASGFEKYLMEGEAPTPELQRAFRNFKKWLTDIYRAIKNIVYTDADGQQQAFEISDDIRGVMDRMLAGEEEIEASRTLREARDIAETLKARGIPDDVSARYKDLVEQGADRAKAKLYRKLVSELRDEKRAELKELKKEARRQAGREVWEQPEYKALKALRMPPEKGGLRLSMPALVEQLGTTEAETLVKELPFGVVANVGLDLETTADLLGYPSGDALIEDLKKAKATPPAKAISDRVRAETEQFGSLAGNPEALRREVEEALHGSERLEWMALEEQLLREEAEKVGESIGEEQQKEQREQGRREEREANEQARRDATRDWRQWADDMAARAAAYEETAKKIMTGKTLSEATRTGFYMAAERRAADKAYRAAMEGKSWLAAEWKQREMLNHALAAESLRIKEELEAGERLVKKYRANRKKLRGIIGEEHFAQIMGLLERTGFNQSDPRSAGRPRLTDWIRRIGAEKQIDLPIARWIQDLDVRDTRTSPRSMSVDAFRDVVDAVKMIDHVGRQENRLLADARNANFAETVDALEAATLKKHGAPKPQSIDPNQEGTGLFGRTLGTLDRAETLLRMADGFEDQGAWWDTFYRPTQRAFVAELEKSKKAKGDIEALFRKHFPDEKAFAKFLNEKFDTGLIDPGTGKKLYWTGENLLSAMLNWGNDHNRERLVFGNGFDRNIFNNAEGRYADDGAYYAAYENGRRTVGDILNRLAKDEHWDFVQDVWDWLDTFWPEIEKLEREMTGVAPEKVEASPVRTGSGKVLRGGYYPVRFDSNLDWRSMMNDETENAKTLYETQSRRASTRHGHTKERVERIIGRPLKLSLNVIQEHAGNVIHDLTHRPVIRDLTKLVQNDRIRELLTHAVGKEGFKQFNPWIQGMAAPTRPVDATDQFVSKIMGNASAVQLGLNVISMIGQTVGLVPASWKLGPAGTAKAVLNTLSLRGIRDGKYRDSAFNLSPELKDRINGTDRNIRAALDLERADTKNRIWNEAKAGLYLGLGWADMAISLPIWTAAYDQGLKKFNGDQQKAIDHADYVVRTSQNTGAAKDLAQIQRGSPFKKLFTMYYSAFGSLYQLFREEMVRAGKTGIPGKLRLAAFCFMMFTVQSALEDLIKGRSPWDEDEEPDDEEIAKWLMQGSFSTFASMFPGFRDIASASMGGYGGYRPSPALEGGSAVARAAKNVAGDIRDLAWDTKDLEDPEVGKTLKSVFDAGGYAFGLPTTQLSRWGKTFMRWVNAETDFSPWELIRAKRGKK